MSSFEEEFRTATTAGPGQITPGAVAIAADKTGKIHTLLSSGSTSTTKDSRPITPDSTFWIASCTKLVTAIAIMQCVERGLVNLDDDISAHLPEWSHAEILTGFDESTGEPLLKETTKKITVRQLMTHSSGIGYDFISPDLKKWREWNKIDSSKVGAGNIPLVVKMPLLFEPGQGWTYGHGIDWAGQIVERVNGNIPLGDYMKTHIWEPLGLKMTTFQPSQHQAVLDALCSMTLKTPTGELISTSEFTNHNSQDAQGGGALYSTPSEYIKILVALLKNDGTLLKPETVNIIFESQIPDDKYLIELATESPSALLYTNGISKSQCKRWNYGLGGILNKEAVAGVANEGAMSWGGLPNLYWWIDPKGGHCGLYASQLVPPMDMDSIALALAFRKEVFKQLSKQ
ncbi:MAG: hypothetical protein M1818_005820 [Claussenomyces sp. TS43310]|nr:MAG: hypothetical protein M1818_005820 [Claussenomyces sp. TS43310]